jgi:hypothetical protein
MKSAVSLILLGLLASVNAFSNLPTVPGRKSGYTYGSGTSGVVFEAVYDLTCSDCKYADPEFQKFLDLPFLTTTVRDQITVTYTFFPLPYHHECWFVHKFLTYFEDQCRTDGQTCNYLEYINFALTNQNDVLNAKSSLEADIVSAWIAKVAT